MHISKIAAAVTVGMEPQTVADIVGVPLEQLQGYGNGYASLFVDGALPTSTPVSPKEGGEPQDGESEAPKPKPKAKRKKSVKADG